MGARLALIAALLAEPHPRSHAPEPVAGGEPAEAAGSLPAEDPWIGRIDAAKVAVVAILLAAGTVATAIFGRRQYRARKAAKNGNGAGSEPPQPV